MMRNFKLLILTSVLAIACDTENLNSQEAVTSAAEAFLRLIDQGNYRESWSDAATLARNEVEQDDWALYVGDKRGTLGLLDHREVATVEFHESLEGVPDGAYATLKFDGTFAGNGRATEVVVLTLDGDSTWRVIGYYIQ